jgi:hypothetical protein
MIPSRAVRRQRAWLAAAAIVGCASEPGRRAEPDRVIPGVTVNAPCVDDRCDEGMICHDDIDGRAGGKRCLLEPGRCRDEWDCGSSVQRCRRFGTRLGVCQDSGL